MAAMWLCLAYAKKNTYYQYYVLLLISLCLVTTNLRHNNLQTHQLVMRLSHCSEHHVPHHSFVPLTCVSSSICTLSPPLMGHQHKTSPCHLYRHNIRVDQDGSHLKTVQQDDISASDMLVISHLGVPQDILTHHFGSGYPETNIKIIP